MSFIFGLVEKNKLNDKTELWNKISNAVPKGLLPQDGIYLGS